MTVMFILPFEAKRRPRRAKKSVRPRQREDEAGMKAGRIPDAKVVVEEGRKMAGQREDKAGMKLTEGPEGPTRG